MYWLVLHYTLICSTGWFSVFTHSVWLATPALQAPVVAAGSGYVSFTGRSGRATFVANGAAGDAAGAPAPEPTPGPTPGKAKAPSKPRLPGLDSLRFFLIAYIAVGHFVAFATKDAFLLKLFTQVSCECLLGQAASF